MLSNWKTTIPGYCLLIASVLTLAAHAIAGNIGAGDFPAVLSGLTGLGLIGAKDGGH